MKRKVLAVLGSWEALLVLMLVVALAVGAHYSPVFLTPLTVNAIMGDFAEKSVMVLTMTLIIIVGEIDLSVASTLGLASVTLGLLSQHHWPLPAAIFAALLVGVACGAINAFFVVRQKLPSLVVTLGTLALFRGLASVLIGAGAVSSFRIGSRTSALQMSPERLSPCRSAAFWSWPSCSGGCCRNPIGAGSYTRLG